MRAVPEFGHALLKPLGAPKGRIATFAEVQLKDGAGKTHIPDGAIVVERGKTSWTLPGRGQDRRAPSSRPSRSTATSTWRASTASTPC